MTPKSQRQPPSRILENYVLTTTIDTDTGLTNIHPSAFDSRTLFSASLPGGDDALSPIVHLGFKLNFDGISYDKIVVSTNGWMALAAPSATTALSVANSLLTSASWENEGVSLNNSSDSTLLCPWFDDLRNTYNTSDQIAFDFSSSERARMDQGFDVPSISYNNTQFGTQIFYDTRSRDGRRTIVRWNSFSNYLTLSTSNIITFESVIYENGTIEFRYAPRRSILFNEFTVDGDPLENATIGVFGRGANRFRDFAQELGYLSNHRPSYKYGGAAYNASFVDEGTEIQNNTYVSRPYVWRLTPSGHWPGQRTTGAVMRFSPPQLRRRVLPRTMIKLSDAILSTNVGFDDRKTINFGVDQTVNYPTTMNRFHGGTSRETLQRQNLFNGSGNDFEVAASTSKTACDEFLNEVSEKIHRPFDEVNRHELDVNVREDSYFVSGSGIIGETLLNQPLWSKTAVRVTLPIDYATKLLGTTSSLYYYNSQTKSWMLPRNTEQIGFDIGSGRSDAENNRVLEDIRGFGPIGNFIASGTNVVSSIFQSIELMNRSYTHARYVEAIGDKYDNTILLNDAYSAVPEETFKLPINNPFIIEKAIIDVPLAAGAGWFNDKTTTFHPITTNTGSTYPGYDFAGPGLTFAIMNQIDVGDYSRRDLILSGTVTHAFDMTSSLELSNFPSISSRYQLRPTGFSSYAQPSCVIQPVNMTFTGSAVVKTEAMISNGITMFHGSHVTNSADMIERMRNRETDIRLASNYIFRIAHINPMCRAKTGFDPSGRSVFGKEFTTNQTIAGGLKIPNPFYVTGSQFTALSSSIASLGTFTANMIATVPIISTERSPYLVMPDDTLVLALGKTRPFFYNATSGPEFSGSLSHDVQMITGSVTITFYGSMLSDGQEKHNNKKAYASNVIMTTIGDEPILDQFEVSYPFEWIGSQGDDFITGSLVTLSLRSDNVNSYIQGERGRIFSKFYASGAGNPTTNSKAFNSNKWSTQVGLSNVSSHINHNERYWDSMCPNVMDCFKRDNSVVWFASGSTRGPVEHVARRGYIIFDHEIPSLSASERLGRNQNWNKSFPFESRYSGISRLQNVENSFVISSFYDESISTMVSVAPTQVPGFFFGHGFTWVSDVNLATTGSDGFYVTGSAGVTDMVKGLYGFGDQNTCRMVDTMTGPVRVGTNKFPSLNHIDQATILDRYGVNVGIRGWRYGLISGVSELSKAYFRRNHYGQFRDMLEQRPDAKWSMLYAGRGITGTGVVQVKFVDSQGSITRPENTQSQNLSHESTSSLPYFDGEVKNRGNINVAMLNQQLVTMGSDPQNNLEI